MKKRYIMPVLLFIACFIFSSNAFAQITIDGSFGDWNGVSALTTDATGDGASSCDFTSLYVTDDAQYVYLRISFTSGSNVSTSSKTINLFVSVDPQNEPASATGLTYGWWSNGYDFYSQLYTENVDLYRYTGTGSDWSWSAANTKSEIAWNSGYNDVEVRLPKSELNTPNITGFASPKQIAVYVQASDYSDEITSDAAHGGILYTLTSPLPVELTSFSASVKENLVELKWETATENNNWGFEIERAQKNKNDNELSWLKVGFIKVNGSSVKPKYYSFTDKNLSFGQYMYRLKQVDNNGSFKYSKTIEVNFGSIPKGFVLNQNYPNPFNPTTTIKFAVSKKSRAVLKVYNMLGAEVATLFDGLAKSNQVYKINFNAASLPSGIYVYKLQTNEKSEIKKMVLLK